MSKTNRRYNKTKRHNSLKRRDRKDVAKKMQYVSNILALRDKLGTNGLKQLELLREDDELDLLLVDLQEETRSYSGDDIRYEDSILQD